MTTTRALSPLQTLMEPDLDWPLSALTPDDFVRIHGEEFVNRMRLTRAQRFRQSHPSGEVFVAIGGRLNDDEYFFSWPRSFPAPFRHAVMLNRVDQTAAARHDVV